MERISYQDIPKGMFEKLMSIEEMINKSTLDFKLMELIRLRVAQINGCAYCVDMHHKELKYAGETDLRLASVCVWKDTPYFTLKERVTLEFAEKLTLLTDEPLDELTHEQLNDHFDKSEIALLTLAIAQINTWTRLMKTFKFTPGNYEVKHN